MVTSSRSRWCLQPQCLPQPRIRQKLQSPFAAEQADSPSPTAVDTAKKVKAPRFAPQPIEIPARYRPQDRRGLNMFEAPKKKALLTPGSSSPGVLRSRSSWLRSSHSNAASAEASDTAGVTDAKPADQIGSGFNNAVANLYMNAQIASGIRVSLTSNLSSRHHNETCGERRLLSH